ncbi:MAG: structural protein [Caudoviricetes sp.]|nr:MAG: structural protein [Caudoviricetes sp.]
MSCITEIIKGVGFDCATVNAAIGSNKDLILVNYKDFDKVATLAVGNREIDNLDENLDGLTSIILKPGALQYTFEGTDYSVIPTVTPEIKEDGDMSYIHQILFTVYSKLAKDRKVLEDLDGAKVIGIVRERSTGLYELFGIDQGLMVSAIERTYQGAQNSNYYQVTLLTPEKGIVKETSLGELAVNIQVT